MRQLLPEPCDDVVLTQVYGGPRDRPTGRPWLLLDMVTSLDGATSLAGRSGGLGGPADRQVFHTLRSLADVILVGAGTVRAEGYGPVRIAEAIQEARVLRGQSPVPRLAVVSRRLDLDLRSELFTASTPPPLVVTCPGAPTSRRVEVAGAADLLLAGQDSDVDLVSALRSLGELGAELVVCEGGPMLNGQLLAADLVDEVCLTLAPSVVGGTSSRVGYGSELPSPHRFDLAGLLEDHGELFVRAVRRREA